MIHRTAQFKYKGKTIIERVEIKPPFKHQGVLHDEGCFLYLKGAEGQLLSSEDNFKFRNESKEAVLLKCDTYFLDFIDTKSDETVELIAVHLFPDVIKKLYADELPKLIQQKSENPSTGHVVDQAVISRFIDSLTFYFDNPTLVNDDLLELKIKELMLLLVQTNNIDSIKELVADLYTPRSVSIHEVVSLHLYSNLTVEELAELCNMSLSSFKREFKKIFNDTPAKYISAERIKKAKELLLVDHMTISDASYEVGYNDPLYFSRIFKQREGITPTQFVAQNKK